MAKEPDSIMTIEEVATYLKIPKSTVYILAQEGKIPCQKVGRQWLFRKNTIDKWLDSQSDVKSTK
jgi:excisionase family DNA binding protein